MTVGSKTEHQIEVKLFKGDVIATIIFDQSHVPQLINVHESFRKRLNDVLSEIGNSALPLQIEPVDGKNEEGKRMISDRVQYCSPGQEGYEYAFADELVHHRLSDGSGIRGIVRT